VSAAAAETSRVLEAAREVGVPAPPTVTLARLAKFAQAQRADLPTLAEVRADRKQVTQ
jgi:hypothetical protein